MTEIGIPYSPTILQLQTIKSGGISSSQLPIRVSQKSHILSCLGQLQDLVAKFHSVKGFFKIFMFKGVFGGVKSGVYMIFKRLFD